MEGTLTTLPSLHTRYAVDQAPRGERRVLLERVPKGATVLDVGCWAGAAGEFLIQHRGATVDGVEPEERMADLASRVYRDVYVGTFENFLALNRGSYDRILFLDVLEHLQDPDGPLRRSRDFLNAGGRVLVSIPNVAHWSLRKELLLGRWRYQESGLLDRTHLHFFSVDSAAELLINTGWEITWKSASLGQLPLVSLPERWLRVLRWFPSLFAVQALFEARPAEHRPSPP